MTNRCGTGRETVSRTAAGATSTAAPESSSNWCSSRWVYPGFTGTATSPARNAPKYATAKSGTLGSAIATRAGYPMLSGTSRARSARAVASTSASSSPHVTVRSCQMSAGLSVPAPAAARRTRLAMFTVGESGTRPGAPEGQ